MTTPRDPSLPAPNSLPRWLKRNVPKGNANHFTANLIGRLHLQTVCDHAKCPNRMECYSQKTATFMILGDVCTRTCRFCSVTKGRPLPPDPDEPRRVAEAAHTLGLRHIVITCVTRDDLDDGGADHFVKTIEAIRRSSGQTPETVVPTYPDMLGATAGLSSSASTNSRGNTAGQASSGTQTLGIPLLQPTAASPAPTSAPTIEVLPSDFGGNRAAVDRLIEAAPEVYNHNTETVPRLYHVVRDRRTNYAWTLEMFRRIRRGNPGIAVKTGLMLGLGETTDELLDTLAELCEAGCSRLTLGQYLRPSPMQTPVVRYVPPEEFERLGEQARRIGFEHVAAGPFVRSSYHAGEMMRPGPGSATSQQASP